MHGVCLDHPLQNWFDHKVPSTSHPADLIENYLNNELRRQTNASHLLVWLHASVSFNTESKNLQITTKQESFELETNEEEGRFIEAFINDISNARSSKTFAEFQEAFESSELGDFSLFWYGALMEELKEIGLLVI